MSAVVSSYAVNKHHFSWSGARVSSVQSKATGAGVDLDPFGKAFEVRLSTRGKELNEREEEEKRRQLQEDKLTESEEKLQKMEEHDKLIAFKKERLALLEERLQDESLTDNDRKAIENDVIRLRQESETTEDRVAVFFVEKQTAEEQLEELELSAAEMEILRENISFYNLQIEELQREMKERVQEKLDLQLQAVQERAERTWESDKESAKSGNAPYGGTKVTFLYPSRGYGEKTGGRKKESSLLAPLKGIMSRLLKG